MNATNSSPDPKRPLMIQRFRPGQEKGEIWQRTFAQLKKYRNTCDEVWFSTGLGFAPLSKHRETAANIIANTPQLNEIGITPSLQIQQTLGHSDNLSATWDNSALNWGRYLGKNGEQCKYTSCPRQEGFLEYFAQIAQIYAACNLGAIWFDDDLRLHNHSPACEPCGCYCSECLALFSAQEGKEYTREELVAATLKDIDLYERWQNFSIEGLSNIVKLISTIVHKISPSTRIGLQHGSQEMQKCNTLYQTIYESTGKRSASRPGGGAYNDHDPYYLITTGFNISYQLSKQAGYELLDQICPEIETFPRTFCCKTSQGLRVESLCYLALGADSLSYFIIDPTYETPEWYGKEILAPLDLDAINFKEYINYNKNTTPQGLGLVGKDFNIHNLGLPLLGIPVAGHHSNSKCKIITTKTIDSLSAVELKEILSTNILLDGEAVLNLHKRGLSYLIEDIQVEPEAGLWHESYTDNFLTTNLDSKRHFPYSTNSYSISTPIAKNMQVIGHYEHNNTVSSLIVTRKDGSKIAILGHGGFLTTNISSSRVNLLYRIVDWLSDYSLPILPLQPIQCTIVPRVDTNGNLHSVTILNSSIAKQKPFEILMRNLPLDIEHAQWNVPSNAPIPLKVNRDSDKCTIEIPEIAAWDIGWLSFQH